MQRAIDLSRQNVKEGGGPFGAVIVKNGKIIAEGVNRVTRDSDPTGHAEINAIRQAARKLNSFELKGCEIYSSCEPCPMCLGAIYWARMEALYFANSKSDAAAIKFDDGFIYEEIGKKRGERFIKTEQIMRSEALKAFVDWKEKDDKTPY